MSICRIILVSPLLRSPTATRTRSPRRFVQTGELKLSPKYADSSEMSREFPHQVYRQLSTVRSFQGARQTVGSRPRNIWLGRQGMLAMPVGGPETNLPWPGFAPDLTKPRPFFISH